MSRIRTLVVGRTRARAGRLLGQRVHLRELWRTPGGRGTLRPRPRIRHDVEMRETAAARHALNEHQRLGRRRQKTAAKDFAQWAGRFSRGESAILLRCAAARMADDQEVCREGGIEIGVDGWIMHPCGYRLMYDRQTMRKHGKHRQDARQSSQVNVAPERVQARESSTKRQWASLG